jgi:HK97 family phage prohead protease
VIRAAVFGNVDRQGDVIEPGAFTNLDEFVSSGWIAWSHRMEAMPVAFPVEAEQDPSGLVVIAEWHTSPEAVACRTVVQERLKAGKSCPASIGYTVSDEAYEKQDGRMIRRLKALSLYECSVCNLAANPAAAVISA